MSTDAVEFLDLKIDVSQTADDPERQFHVVVTKRYVVTGGTPLDAALAVTV